MVLGLFLFWFVKGIVVLSVIDGGFESLLRLVRALFFF